MEGRLATCSQHQLGKEHPYKALQFRTLSVHVHTLKHSDQAPQIDRIAGLNLSQGNGCMSRRDNTMRDPPANNAVHMYLRRSAVGEEIWAHQQKLK